MAEQSIRSLRRRRLKPGSEGEIDQLRESVAGLETEVAELRRELESARTERQRMREVISHAAELLILRLTDGGRLAIDAGQRQEPYAGGLRIVPIRRSRAEIAEAVSNFLNDPDLANLPDPEIAARLGVARQTVTNWRRRLLGTAGRERRRLKRA